MKKEEIKNKIGEMKAKAIKTKDKTVQFVKDNKGFITMVVVGFVGAAFVEKTAHSISEVDAIKDKCDGMKDPMDDYDEQDLQLNINGKTVSGFLQRLDPDVNCIWFSDDDLRKIVEDSEQNEKE